jgi:hypothetical protein
VEISYSGVYVNPDCDPGGGTSTPAIGVANSGLPIVYFNTTIGSLSGILCAPVDITVTGMYGDSTYEINLIEVDCDSEPPVEP